MAQQDSELTPEHCFLSLDEARAFVAGREITQPGGRTMDAKAQIVVELFRTVRPPDQIPTPEESREQLRKAVALFGETAVPLSRREDLTIPGPAGGLRCRVYDRRPVNEGPPRPVLLFLHGGGWVQGDLDTHDALCARLAAGSDSIVLALDYRLAPEHKFPAAFDDTVAAYLWLLREAATLHGDAERVAVAGDSAGGNLAAALCQWCVTEAVAMPAFQVLIYPSLDLAFGSESHRAMPDDAVLPKPRLLWYAQQYIRDESDADDVRVSPLRALNLRGQPPALMITGGFDPLRDEGRHYAERLAEAGVSVTSHEYPGQIHAFTILGGAIPEARVCLREIAEYMDREFDSP